MEEDTWALWYSSPERAQGSGGTPPKSWHAAVIRCSRPCGTPGDAMRATANRSSAWRPAKSSACRCWRWTSPRKPLCRMRFWPPFSTRGAWMSSSTTPVWPALASPKHSRPSRFQQIFDVNFFGVVRVNRAVLPSMRQRRSGLLIHVSSGAGRVAVPAMAAYCASKFALEALADAYRFELLPVRH